MTTRVDLSHFCLHS